ncbi:bacteriocin immunity protein [Lactiplantibacillus modestisalitolerans]|uniref:Bacteriocin immunity protein n=1 Tax=Lactiplantibacillus modestisalitolerans TaxID=1457219 RepID=A0ABV5WVZ2_9LACO|nr:bacteriocin immunity protein [Lactiplantibacillus modestisalitolerans]
MLKNENAIALTRAINIAYDDPEVQAIPELRDTLLHAAHALDRVADHHQVAADLYQTLTAWGNSHPRGPQALDQLYWVALKDGTGLRASMPYQQS